MKKISFYTKLAFHISNILMILLYIYPGSIMGWLVYRDLQKQPELASGLPISFNHVIAFFILSLLGNYSFGDKRKKLIFIYLFFISIILELCHLIIPERGFEYGDLFGNLIGVFLVFLFSRLILILKY